MAYWSRCRTTVIPGPKTNGSHYVISPDAPLFESRVSKENDLIAGLVCSIGGTVFGYDLGARSAVSQNLRSEFSLSPSLFGLTIAASLWGTVLGSLFAGYVAISLGRRRLIASCALIYAISSTGIALFGPAGWGLVLALRFLCGIAIGGFTVGCPLYLAEIASSKRRGRFVAWFQVQVGIGVVLGFATGYVVAHLEPLALYWRFCLGFGAIPAVILLIFFHRMPEEANLFHRQHKNNEASIIKSAGSGFMHESFNAQNPNDYTRPWFAWCNSLFGELVVRVTRLHPAILERI